MTEKRIKFNNIVSNQLPSYVREEFPLVAEFLKQYYISQEFQGAATDLIQNIDQYLKLDNIKGQVEEVTLGADISFSDEVITVGSESGTLGFPDSYGLLQIDNEIITYTSKTSTSFTGCIRGFSGVSSYSNQNNIDDLVFSQTESADHTALNSLGEPTKIINLSSLFLKEFFNKIKYQLTPGFESREFYSGLDKYLFLKQSKDFYSTRGTDISFKILFKVLYGEDVKIIKPQDYLIKPSESQYEITNDLVVESISGNPYDLERSTLNQDEYSYAGISKGYAPISRVEKIFDISGKVYYKLSFDAGYNKDIIVDGSLYGNFSIHPKTKNIGDVLSSANTIDVDSTVGFPSQGELSVLFSDGTKGIVSYTSKSINQFFGCEGINGTILDSSDIWLNVYAYGESNKNNGEIITVRVTSVLTDVDILDDTYYYDSGNTSIIKTLGFSSEDDIVANNWIFNFPTVSEVSSIALVDNSNKTYRVTTPNNHNLREGDIIKVISNDGVEKTSNIISIISDTVFNIRDQGELDLSKSYTIKRNIFKINSTTYPSLSNQFANVQNVYKDSDKTLVASSSLPRYDNQPLNPSTKTVIFSLNNFVGDSFTVITVPNKDHGFYTGDSVYYTSGTGSSFENGVYYVYRVNSTTIKLAKSRSNIYNSIFINIPTDTPVTSIDNKIEDYNFYSRTLESQKILREIDVPINDDNEHVTTPGPLGILINGTEILNYKSTDKVYYGPLEKIDVVNSGSEYDIINPPEIIIRDIVNGTAVGTGATGYCAVNGSLREIRIIDPGFDYIETPTINIYGGNGSEAKVKASMKLVDHKVFFNSEAQSAQVDITNNIIGFSTYHKFRNVERVIYRTDSQQGVGGISTNSQYYVSVKDSTKVQLHKTFDDALSGINTISLISYGVGNHILESYNKKLVVASINVEDSGFNYQNKKRTVTSSGISTSSNQITIKNHDFKTGEVLKYFTNQTPIGGLSNNSNYYVTAVDDDNFKLSLVGVGSDNKDFYYNTKQYIKFTSSGTGIHTFNYPEISVEVVGNVGVSSISGNSFKAVVQPIFRGEITSIHLSQNGVGYGSSEIINFNREPSVELDSGSEAQLIPIINDGKIAEVLINNPGKNYNSPPNLNIITRGKGVGAVLTPILEGGKIKSVKIIESGIGYDSNNTFVTVESAGTGCKFSPKIKTWTVNLVQKYLNQIGGDDGVVYYNPISKYGLQYTHLYAPRKLRENIYPKNSNNELIYGKKDLRKVNNVEITSTDHSPIIGWAYDGNPIYGPYGYSKINGSSTISLMKSGYNTDDILEDRPPFPTGFFVEDYKYNNRSEDDVLDEHNGRFCVTPEFPNGVYAYFATIADRTPINAFSGYRLPVFPYIIGNKFKSRPNDFNFKRSSNQDDINLNLTKWKRNTYFYNLEKNSSYSYISLPNSLNQTVDIKYASPGPIESINIISGGVDYKINDKVLFDDEGTGGFGFASKVSKISGKEVNSISVASTTLYNAQVYPSSRGLNSFIIETSSPHNLLNGDVISISGLNTTSISLGKFYTVGLSVNTLSLSNPSGIGNTNVTGIVTYISVSGNLSSSDIRENDIFAIGTEKVKVLNVDKVSSRLRVLREVQGTVGTSHSYSDILYEIPRKFVTNLDDQIKYEYKENREIYFSPKDSLGIGTFSGVGIGYTISLSNPGVGITQIFVPTRSIYLPNHNLNTGDSLLYSSNSSNSISVSINGSSSFTLPDQSTVYVAKISNDLIGISTVKVGLGSTGVFSGIGSTNSSSGILYFTGFGTGEYHSFKTKYSNLTCQVSKNTVTVSTAQSHGLIDNDYVFLDVKSGISTTQKVVYNDYNRKILINPKTFSSSNVNIENNTITIQNHRFKTGQKVVYTSNSPSIGLINEQIYYVVVLDADNIGLSLSLYDATSKNPQIVDISSQSSGTISLINPPIQLYRNSTVIFDLSDSSLSYLSGSKRYSAFELNLYSDSKFTQKFNTSKNSNVFEVSKEGRVGIDTNAKVTLTVNDGTPRKLFYNLEPLNDGILELPLEKEEINADTSVVSNNEIDILLSEYSGRHQVVSSSSNSFTYNLAKMPESPSYNSTSSLMKYETTSLSASGSISDIKILSKGQNYYSLPNFSTVISQFGKNAILEVDSRNVGKIKKTKINDIGFDFPSDSTLKPNLSLPQILKIEPLNSLDSIKISSVGRGYTVAPKLLVFDGKSGEFLPEIELKYSLNDSYVTILTNSYRLNNVTPTIIPVQNSNGVGISSISYNSLTKNVTVRLSVGFSTDSAFPFSVGDKVLIENVSVGVNTSGKGYNSENYNYNLFTITGIDKNIGANQAGIVTYSMADYLNGDELPGTYDEVNSSGRIIPQKYFPTFISTLKSNDFYIDEDIKYSDQKESIGFVESWDKKTKYLKVLTKETLKNGNVLEGVSSRTRGIISSSIKNDAFINTGPYSKVNKGWNNNIGFLNDNLQRLQDNFYYQNFSYSLKSRVSYDTWENAVGSLNHTAGFKKFSDYQLESYQYSGIGTDAVSRVDVTTDIIGFANLNCVYDFDLASENALINGSRVISDEITFSSRILTDYFESVGNRVLSIDDISKYFNSSPRQEICTVVHKFPLIDARAQKYITYVKDRRFTGQRQILILTLLRDEENGYLNQYGRVESSYDLGSFDFEIEGNEGLILFCPTRYRFNDYDVTTLSYNVKDNFAGVGSTNIGGVVDIKTNTTTITSGSGSIVSLASTIYTSVKILAEAYNILDDEYQFNEISVVHDGTNVEFIEYGELTNSPSNVGQYTSYISGSDLKVDFTPNVGVAASVSSIQVAFANTNYSGIGTFDMKYSRFEARTTSIASSTSPNTNTISEYPVSYDGGYYIVQVSDTTNNRHSICEIVILNDENQVYFTEFANLETYNAIGIGTFGAEKDSNFVRLTFKPRPNINVKVNAYLNTLTNFDEINSITSYNNNTFTTDYATYYGTERDVKRSFELTHKGDPIFQKYFDGSSSSVVSIGSSVLTIQNHFFTTGEKLNYSYGSPLTSSPIGIGTTDFGVGIGTTDKLPSSVYAIKVDENRFRLARSAEDALNPTPNALVFTSVGIGTRHTFTSNKQNAKVLVSIDNVIQSPIVSTSNTTTLSKSFTTVEDVFYSNSVNNLFIGDFVKIDDEIMKVESVGFGSTNAVRVARPWFGTKFSTHSNGSTVTKIVGNYNIIDNTINFADAPYGNIFAGQNTNNPDEQDWVGIFSGSSFHGRSFMRSGVPETTNEAYAKNYIFNDISSGFDGVEKNFVLKQDNNNLVDFYSDNAVILINDIFQEPGITNNYTLSEAGSQTSLSFVGTEISKETDINSSSLPSGGIIVSVGSTFGFGYQPLVCAGGTAIVSTSGTISAISIGNSGSGYRSAIYTPAGVKSNVVRVGVATSSTGTPDIQYIGTATVNKGNIVSIAITNPGFGFTSSNVPYVLIDDPLPYSDIPLIYSSPSSGIGSFATIDIVVGQGSSVIDFEIKNLGYGYKPGDVLTVPIGGATGIPTTSNVVLNPFKITVDRTFSDKFTGWSIGELQPLDSIERLFNGSRTIFTLSYSSQIISIYAKKGSLINIQDVILVFINDILQVPGEGYIFNGGSKIRFTEPPKEGDTCKILFYKGSGDNVDVIFRNTIQTVKIGDDVTLTYDSFVGQPSYLLEDPRDVSDVLSIDTVETLPYFGPGNVSDQTLLRPINWCRQTEDKIINELEVNKEREFYEPLIYPSSYLISSVGIGSTIVFVDNIRPFFNPLNENNLSLEFQKKITFISQVSKVASSATAIVSSGGTISSISLTNGGSGYDFIPNVTIQRPSGIATVSSTAVASITSGIVTSISMVGVTTGYSQQNPPIILIDPPTLETEENKVRAYSGDFGIISGISTVSVGVASTGIVFDLVIPKDSYLRNSSITGVTTISGIQTGYYFTIFGSNVGNGVTSLDSSGSIAGIAKSFLDGVYYASSVSIAQTSVAGFGVTYVAKVTVSVSDYNGLSGIGYSGYYGNYSWGRIILTSRSKPYNHEAQVSNGYVGIFTGTILNRTEPLKYSGYIS